MNEKERKRKREREIEMDGLLKICVLATLTKKIVIERGNLSLLTVIIVVFSAGGKVVKAFHFNHCYSIFMVLRLVFKFQTF